jgi:hypothetical protein
MQLKAAAGIPMAAGAADHGRTDHGTADEDTVTRLAARG